MAPCFTVNRIGVQGNSFKAGRRNTRHTNLGRVVRSRVPLANRAEMARAVMVAVEPLVELLLDLGITSPEAESLLRSLFVHKSREWLMRQNGAGDPSDVRIALITGVHRNFVSRLLAEPPKIAEARQRKGHRAARLLHAWYSEALYLDSSGKPRDLPERGPAPSFEALVRKYLPGPTPGVVLQELRRGGAVRRLGERVRVLGRTIRTSGINISNIKEIGVYSTKLLETLAHNLRNPNGMFCESLPSIEVDDARIPIVREVIGRRASAFLQSLEAELASERRRFRRRKSERTTVSLTVFESGSRR